MVSPVAQLQHLELAEEFYKAAAFSAVLRPMAMRLASIPGSSGLKVPVGVADFVLEFDLARFHRPVGRAHVAAEIVANLLEQRHQ